MFLLVAYAGEYHSVVIHTEEDKPCCECDCEYDPETDPIRYGEDLRERYIFFGGVPHLCFGTRRRDEKGFELGKNLKPHVCRGEWCPKECCRSVDDYFYSRLREEGGLFPTGHRPTRRPTPPPCSVEN